MAAGCFGDGKATLVVHEDGTATITTAVQAVSSDKLGATQSDAATEWTIYEDTEAFLSSSSGKSTSINRVYARVDATKTVRGRKKPSKLSFTIPDNEQNVVATRMYISVMSVYQDACIGIDWANVTKVSDDTSASTTVDRKYVVMADADQALTYMREGMTLTLPDAVADNEDFKQNENADQVVLDEKLDADATVAGGTLDLNGHTLNQGTNLITLEGDTTITDSSEDKSGVLESTKEKGASVSDQTSVFVKKALTMDGITFIGQVGNHLTDVDTAQYTQTGLPSLSVTVKDSKLSSPAIFDGCVKFSLKAGVDFTAENSTFSSNITLKNNSGKINIKDSSTQSISFGVSEGSAGTDTEAILNNCKVNGLISGGVDTLSVKDTEVTGGTAGALKIDTEKSAVLENVTATSGYNRKGTIFVTSSNIGDVIIESGSYVNTGRNSYALYSEGVPITVNGGYFKGVKGAVYGAYDTPEGTDLKEVTEGEYSGYYTLQKVEEETGTIYVAEIYDAEGKKVKSIKESDAAYILAKAKAGQTVKLMGDVTVEETLNSYRDIVLDLNGHQLTTLGLSPAANLTVKDSSAEKAGKLKTTVVLFAQTGSPEIHLEGIQAEASYIGYGVGSVEIKDSEITGVTAFNYAGETVIYDVRSSKWQFADGVDGKSLLEGVVRTSRYTITYDESTGYYTVAPMALADAFEKVEALDEADYTADSWKAVKDLYDEADAWADEDVTKEESDALAAKLEAAIAALVKAPTEEETKAADEAAEEAKKVKASDYTEESYKKVEEAMKALEAAKADPNTSAADLAKAVEALNDAVKGLVKAEKKSDNNNNKNNNNNNNTNNNSNKNNGSTAAKIKVGQTVTVKGLKYKVTSVSAKGGAVAFTGLKNKKAKKAVIPATVKVNGVTCKVTSIAANACKNCKKLKSVTIGTNVASIGNKAFYGCKSLKKITVKSTKIKKVGKKALYGINKKAVIKVPKKKYKAYKKVFKNKGQKKTVKIKK